MRKVSKEEGEGKAWMGRSVGGGLVVVVVVGVVEDIGGVDEVVARIGW